MDTLPTGAEEGDIYAVGTTTTGYMGYVYVQSEWRQWHSIDPTTIDYGTLLNKPQIQGVTLEGNKTAQDLGLALDNAVVHTTGNESIAGNKTFTGTVNITSSGENWVLDRSNNTASYVVFKYGGTKVGIIGKGSSSRNTIWYNAIAGYGIEMSAEGGIDLNGVVRCSETPTENTHVANKKYVDDSISASANTPITDAQIDALFAPTVTP